MATAVQTPRNVADLVKLMTKHGKRALLVSGEDSGTDRIPAGRVLVDVSNIAALNAMEVSKDKVVLGTGISLGRLARDVQGENGLLRQTASLIASPLVRNRVTLAQALDPESPYFDITTPLALLEAKVRIQSPTSKKTMLIRDFLEAATKGLKKGETPVAIEFTRVPAGERVGFFRVARMNGKGSVSAAARMRMTRNTCTNPELVLSSLTLIPLRSKDAEKELAGKVAGENMIKRAVEAAVEEIGALAEKRNAYEDTLIEITVARTLRSIMEGSISG